MLRSEIAKLIYDATATSRGGGWAMPRMAFNMLGPSERQPFETAADAVIERVSREQSCSLCGFHPR